MMDDTPAPQIVSEHDTQWHTPQQAAELLAISTSYLRKLTARGVVVASGQTPGGHRRYNDQDLAAARAGKLQPVQPVPAVAPQTSDATPQGTGADTALRIKQEQTQTRLEAVRQERADIFEQHEPELLQKLTELTTRDNASMMAAALGILIVPNAWSLINADLHLVSPGQALAIMFALMLASAIGLMILVSLCVRHVDVQKLCLFRPRKDVQLKELTHHKMRGRAFYIAARLHDEHAERLWRGLDEEERLVHQLAQLQQTQLMWRGEISVAQAQRTPYISLP